MVSRRGGRGQRSLREYGSLGYGSSSLLDSASVVCEEVDVLRGDPDEQEHPESHRRANKYGRHDESQAEYSSRHLDDERDAEVDNEGRHEDDDPSDDLQQSSQLS
ncbi:hypothetical protein PMAYCL1PPCAC_11041 [Pristionchus mayeri]|uniref:Uncharacterized protein n=1 Tax=Pristionchus mayeri TaxID=1317129 RepID=A0AAN4ZHE1_9BILA|nr:hypothetical protein PMAYCL1PPCAC_11041 [Pristionchus mayeri]